jgi:hypothetical protein
MKWNGTFAVRHVEMQPLSQTVPTSARLPVPPHDVGRCRRLGGSVTQVLSGCQDGVKTQFEVISNPEFMSAGTAIQDCLHPERVSEGGGAAAYVWKGVGVGEGLKNKPTP